MKALVTGGAGFVGSNLVKRLLEQGHSVKVLDNMSVGKESNVPVGARVIKGDILDKDTVKETVEDVEVIFHLAAITSIQDSIKEPEKTFRINVEGTKTLLEAKKDSQRFVNISSASIYGNPRRLPISENQVLAPISPYGESKMRAEEACHRYKNVVIVRPFNIYGPGQDTSYGNAIPKFIECAKNSKALTVTGDGNNTRDYVHVYDVCNALIRVAESNGEDAYNIGTGIATKDTDLAKLIIRLSRKDLEIEYLGSRPGDVKYCYADISKIKSIGWSPEITLEQGLGGLIR